LLDAAALLGSQPVTRASDWCEILHVVCARAGVWRELCAARIGGCYWRALCECGHGVELRVAVGVGEGMMSIRNESGIGV
jgi:hypothetical protein